jgi:hypothetical protein
MSGMAAQLTQMMVYVPVRFSYVCFAQQVPFPFLFLL